MGGEGLVEIFKFILKQNSVPISVFKNLLNIMLNV